MKNDKQDENLAPALPDPFWPEGVEPQHLSPTDHKDKEVVDAWKEAGIDLAWRCADCGISGLENRSPKDPLFCNACYAKRNTRSALARRTNDNWQEQSEALGLALYERQPEETDDEWLIWSTYRSYYPLKLPTWTALAKKCGCSVAKVTKTAQRWSFKARMIAWARLVDADNQESRIVAAREMSNRQLKMAKTIQEKLSSAIDQLDPSLLRPNEIVSLLKASTDLEQRLRATREEKVESTALETKSIVKPKTKAEDLQEVLEILQSTGVMPSGKKVVGVENKTTVLIKEDE